MREPSNTELDKTTNRKLIAGAVLAMLTMQLMVVDAMGLVDLFDLIAIGTATFMLAGWAFQEHWVPHVRQLERKIEAWRGSHG